MTGTAPLDAYPLIRTGSVEELRAALARLISNPRKLEPVGRDGSLHAVHNHYPLNHIGISYGTYSTAIHFQLPGPKVISQIYPIAGKAEVTVDGTTVTVDATHGAAVSANAAEYNITNVAGYERLIMLVDGDAANAKLAALLGKSIERPLTLRPRHDLSEPLARSLQENFMFLVGQINAGVSVPPLILAELEQTLMVMFLHANRHNYSHLLHREPPGVDARQVRLVEDFIEANWNRPLSFEALAAITGLSIRSLFRGFRQSRGYSPSEFLKQVRLRHARAHLQRPETEMALSEVAFACGFRDRSRFKMAYAQAFGETPEDTLERGQGLRLH